MIHTQIQQPVHLHICPESLAVSIPPASTRAAKPEMTKMDSVAGDGDCGLTLKDGANGVLKALKEGKVSGEDVVGSVIAISKVAEEAMGGTSGAFYSIFSALAQGLADTSTLATADIWSNALNAVLDRLDTYTRARPPSRTLVDLLAAFTEALPSGLEVAVNAAKETAEKISDLEAKARRNACVEGRRFRAERIPDSSTWDIKVVIDALIRRFKVMKCCT